MAPHQKGIWNGVTISNFLYTVVKQGCGSTVIKALA
jgi:hypothetical protein